MGELRSHMLYSVAKKLKRTMACLITGVIWDFKFQMCTKCKNGIFSPGRFWGEDSLFEHIKQGRPSLGSGFRTCKQGLVLGSFKLFLKHQRRARI